MKLIEFNTVDKDDIKKFLEDYSVSECIIYTDNEKTLIWVDNIKPTNVELIECKHCHKTIASFDKFCAYCGEKLC